MGKYESLAKDIVKNVGGKDNINALTHCITRLRFILKDESKANDDVIKNMDGVVTLMKSGGQYQVVIGNHVPDVFAEVCQIAGIKANANNSDDKPKEKKGAGALVLEYMQAIMSPSLGVLCASGILKGMLTLLTMFGILQATDGIYIILAAAGDALLYFFPVFLGYNAATKFGMAPQLGAAIGAALVYPSLQNAEELIVFGFDMSGISYTTTVIPIILIIMVAAPFEKWLKKVIPDVVKTFLVPMIVLTVCVPLGYCIIGPFANVVSDGLGSLVAGVYSFSPILCALILGGFYQILVIFGVHMGFLMFIMVDFMAGTPSPLYPLLGVPAFAQTAVVVAIWLRTKNTKLKGIALPAWISGIFGITEPAIYGVTLPRIKYFVVSCVGAALGALYMAITNVHMFTVAGLGIFSIPGAISADHPLNVVNFLIGIAIAMAFSFIVTFIMYNDKQYGDVEAVEKKGQQKSEMKSMKVTAPIKGAVVALSEIKDEAFSRGILGKGVAIEPVEGKVVAPADGVLTTLFPTCHALGIQTDDGAEILIHIGMDTVQLEGKHFTAKAKQGDQIKKGQVLMEFDMEAIKAAGYSLTTPVVITNTDAYADVVETSETSVNAGDTLIHVLK